MEMATRTQIKIALVDNKFSFELVQRRIQEFQNQGALQFPGTVEFLGSGVCFDVPFTYIYTLCFLVTASRE